ncbi:tRNA guanosine(34) transglycosylase Tgt [bacterium]|nr:tRNA guanosine(34) transglycosylase Tgt [bacterium]
MTAPRRVDFEKLCSSAKSQARRGRLTTPHGVIETPVFMPVGTKGAVKGVINSQLDDVGAQIILGNTYHLWVRPGIETMREMGGLRKWMNWSKPILTDSGGFQVFSLAKLRKIQEDGVRFNSHLDGAPLYLTPEKSIEIQEAIASTIMMVLDECPALPAPDESIKKAVDLSTRWARRCLKARLPGSGALFAIAQGGLNVQMRLDHIRELSEMKDTDSEGVEHEFDGLALGGFSVGEEPVKMYGVLKEIVSYMPQDRPRYLMGVGTPTDLLQAVEAGLDMFDCVMPTRNARNGTLFTHNGMLRIKNERWKHSELPLDEHCDCYTCQNHSRSYLRHLIRLGDLTASVLLTIHNCRYYQKLMEDVREQIESNTFEKFKDDCLDRWRKTEEMLKINP